MLKTLSHVNSSFFFFFYLLSEFIALISESHKNRDIEKHASLLLLTVHC